MTLADFKIGFIGCGKMGLAMMKGLAGSDLVQPDQIMGFDVANRPWDDELRELGIIPAESNRTMVAECDIIVLAVKPQYSLPVFPEIRDMSAGKLFISVIAGLTSATIAAALDDTARVVRVMPNTPCLVGEGASAIAPGATSNGDDDLALARELMGCVGQVSTVKERQIDAVTGMSGSGPAFVFLFMEGLIEAGVRMGLDWDMCRRLAMQTVRGAAILAQQSDTHLAQLRNEVTSPGGTAAAGLQNLERAGFKAIISQAVEAASERAAYLGRQLAQEAEENGSLK